VWRVIDTLFWLPLGNGPVAAAALRELSLSHRQHVTAWARDHDRPMPAFRLASVMARRVPGEAVLALRLIPASAGERSGGHRVAESVMVFVVSPLFVLATGLALGGATGAAVAALLLGVFWTTLFRKLGMGAPVGAGATPTGADPSRVLTVANVITFGRLISVGFFPMVLSANGHLRAMLFLATLNCTDWADGFVARQYGAGSRLGQMLDPAVDRLMVVVVVAAMMADHLLPVGLGALVLLRELAIVVLGVTLFRPGSGEAPRATVHLAGRMGFAILNLALVGLLVGGSAPPPAVRPLGYTGVVAGALLSYFALWEYLRQATGHGAPRPGPNFSGRRVDSGRGRS
jgi:cardiolipin synthase